MKRYKDNAFLIILNIIVEYVILFVTYLVCGFIRAHIPSGEGKSYSYYTIAKFTPFVLVVSFFVIVVFVIMGDYLSLHFRSRRRIVAEAFLVSLIAGVVGSAILFFIEGSQFSRMLLVMLVGAWTIVISIKRVVIQQFANKVMSDKVSTYNVLIIGCGESARRYQKSLSDDSSMRYMYAGYIAENIDINMPRYLGDYSRLREVIAENDINKVVIAVEMTTRTFLNDVLSICAVYGIEAVIIPVYADYISDNQRVRTENGMHVLQVNAFNHSKILGVNIAVTDMDKTINDIRDNLEKWRGQYICISNVHTTVMAHDNPDYREVQNGAVIALPDGGPLSSYSRSEGKKDAKRVTGPDLMKEILIRSKEYGWRHCFYGSTQKTLDMLKSKIEEEYPGAVIVGMISPPYRDLTPEEDAEYIRMINEARPDFVWVGLGAPKQEIWMAAHKDKINGLMLGVGAAFDYESGNLKRAPLWMQKCNLEWLYRFLQEPRRLFKRYFITNIKFLWLTRR